MTRRPNPWRCGSILLPLCLLLGACGSGAPGRDSALLLTLDTTRRDALGCYGGGAKTPNLDGLAREGILFENAHTTVPITLPAHASMLTGLVPCRHGIRENGAGALPDSATTLAELARENGFQTAAILASRILSRPFGLAQGFELYDAPKRSEGSAEARALHGGERSAATVVDAALRWLSSRDRTRPFFLWVHFYDPHAPYAPPPTVASEDPYLGEIEAMDHEIGRLLAALASDGMLAETTILAVADHGESLGEHGEPTHSIYCYEPTLAVPMLLRAADGRRAGERSEATVTVADVFPTLARSMGLSPPDGCVDLDGLSLWDDIPADRAVYFESYYGYFTHHWSPLAGVLDANGKYIQSSEPALFRLPLDPTEEHNLVATEGGQAQRYRKLLARFGAGSKLPTSAAAIDEELMASIQQLGYSGMSETDRSVPGPAEASDLPSPESQSQWLLQYEAAQAFLGEGRTEDAARIFASVLEAHPSDFKAMEELAGIRLEQGRIPEALPLLRRLTSEGPGRARHFFDLGLSLDRTGDTAGARAALGRAVELAPQRPVYARALAELEGRAGGR